MKRLLGLMIVLCVATLGTNVALGCWAEGYIYCDVNQNGTIDPEDTPFEGVVVYIEGVGHSYADSTTTDASGYYYFSLPDPLEGETHTYRETLDETTLPDDAIYVHPASGEYIYEITLQNEWAYHEWLIDSATCRDDEGLCWMTGGGVKFDQTTGEHLAQKGPKHSFGGNVHPSCSSEPGDGGQWNHVAHGMKLHFLGKTIHTVDCGNVPGIPPGSGSPETPFNYIEFEGIGTLKGIKGNKVDYGTVHFWARVEDRNEPGSRGAKDGELIDRYYIHVYSDPMNPHGTTLMLVDEDGDSETVDPVLITGGNLQLHISSCDNPPQ
jgi:hypothetical protein